MSYIAFISYLTLIIWIYLTFFHGRNFLSNEKYFWSNKIIFEKKFFQNSFLNRETKICVIIPARNEEKTIIKTLNAIKKQDVKNLEIIVVNDNSTDNTVEKVLSFKKKFKKLFLLNGEKLPDGWVGKTWALKQGVDLANKKQFDYYNFIDSDIILDKNLLRDACLFVKSEKLSMLTLMAKLNCESFWEKLLIPPFIFFFQKLYPFNSVIKKSSGVAAAAGGFIFCKASLFKKKNLYENIKDKIIDDCNIAKEIKQIGSIWIGLTNRVYSNRKYNELSKIWKMVSRTAFEQLNYSILLLILSLLGLILTYLIPSSVIFYCIKSLDVKNFKLYILLPNFLSFIMMVFIYSPTLKFYKIKKIFSIILPISAIFYCLMTLSSALNYSFFQGNIWKGRKY